MRKSIYTLRMIYTWWKGTQISKFYDVPDKELIGYGHTLLRQGFERGISLKRQIMVYTIFLDNLKDRKDKNKPIRRSDHNYGMNCLMALVKLKVIDLDDAEDGIFRSCPKLIKRKRKLPLHN